MTADTIIDLVISGDISDLDPASINNVYDRHSVPKLMTILAVGEFDDDNFDLSQLLVKNQKGETVFCGNRGEMLKSDPDDEDEDEYGTKIIIEKILKKFTQEDSVNNISDIDLDQAKVYANLLIKSPCVYYGKFMIMKFFSINKKIRKYDVIGKIAA